MSPKPSLGVGLVVKNDPSEQSVTDIVMVYTYTLALRIVVSFLVLIVMW